MPQFCSGGNFLDKMPQEGLAIIESKFKTASLEDKMTIKMNQMMNQMKALVVTTPAPVKAVEEVCVTCGSNHNFNHCPLTRASTSNSGTLPSQTVTNPRQQINAITTRSGKALEEPSIPLVPSPDVSKPQKEPEQNPETSTEKVQNPKLENTAHVPSSGEEDSIFIEIPKPKAKKRSLT
ncbi:hypothetical protein Tco_0598856 [Tanacetum coccineum]